MNEKTVTEAISFRRSFRILDNEIIKEQMYLAPYYDITQIYGDEILDALDNISGELLEASSYPEISRILTEKKIRRSWNIVNVALGFGIESIEIHDQPSELYKQVLEFVQNPKPTLINILCQRHRWHAGSGIDNEPEWNTFEEFLKTVKSEFGHKFGNEMLLNINSTITTHWKSIAHECS